MLCARCPGIFPTGIYRICYLHDYLLCYICMYIFSDFLLVSFGFLHSRSAAAGSLNCSDWQTAGSGPLNKPRFRFGPSAVWVLLFARFIRRFCPSCWHSALLFGAMGTGRTLCTSPHSFHTFLAASRSLITAPQIGRSSC